MAFPTLTFLIVNTGFPHIPSPSRDNIPIRHVSHHSSVSVNSYWLNPANWQPRHLTTWHHLVPKKYVPIIRKDAKLAHVPARLIAAVMHVETHGQQHPARAVSSAGAIGPMQLMPATAWNDLHVNPWCASQNILGGSRYLAQLLKRFHGHVRLALIAYNAGPTATEYDRAPTSAWFYARSVLALYHV
ncbi:lytic transglycosylase domain-containing protein [Acidithiobacillus ferrivorans]|nr:lytic transglycosylase domain-containing protein [Acidithiobacillus ferrivorans]